MKLLSAAIVFTALFFTFNVNAQTQKDTINISKDTINNNSYQKDKEYILGGITVTGLKKFNEETVRVFTGLRVGQTIKLPGDKLTSAIKKLYKSKQFSSVEVYLAKIDGKTVYLQLDVLELPQISDVKITGLKKGTIGDLLKDANIKIGAMVTDNLIVTSKNYITKKYTDKGYLKTKVSLDVKKDTSNTNAVKMSIHVDKGKKIKIKDIIFKGNKALSKKKLRKIMSKTKEKLIGRFWKKSKYIEEDYQKDLESILDKYSRLGYRDARILNEEITWNKDNTVNINIALEEGKQYRFSEILFVGNKEYTDEQLHKLLKIQKGDIYNGALLEERLKGNGGINQTYMDISTLYQNDGFVFSSVNAVETQVKNDSISLEIRINEDEKARIRKVTISGNKKTNDHVIFRELRVKPGDLFSRNALMRTIREIGQLRFFDQKITPDISYDYQNKTIDIGFDLEEKGDSQIQLQGGYGRGAFVGTLGLSFNNFSIKNIFNKEAYNPLPVGDGQSLSLRLETSRNFSTYSFSFTEPWLGGRKPKSLTFSIYSSKQFLIGEGFNVDRTKSLEITGASIGLGQRLKWPDDYFQLSQTISYQSFNLNEYGFRVGSGFLDNGTLNNLSYNATISRNSSTGGSLIFPTSGSEFSIGIKATFPYSLVNNKDYSNLEPEEKYKWLEYYKLNAKGKWYTAFTDKLVLMTNAEMGYLGFYNSKLGYSPFDRYFVGGDGVATFQLDGREVIGLRGYQNNRLSSSTGGTIYNRFQLELRYSILDSKANSTSIYTLGFIDAGNSYDNFKTYNPFDLKRSAGLGIRLFMPAFGLLGVDFGYGFDALPGPNVKSGWQTHFIIGRQF